MSEYDVLVTGANSKLLVNQPSITDEALQNKIRAIKNDLKNANLTPVQKQRKLKMLEQLNGLLTQRNVQSNNIGFRLP